MSVSFASVTSSTEKFFVTSTPCPARYGKTIWV
jgi:hypothetical protein